MSFSVVRNMRTSEGSILHLIPYLSYSGTPLQVLLFSLLLLHVLIIRLRLVVFTQSYLFHGDIVT